MSFSPPSHWQRITTIDAHTAGEPLRVVTSGFPEVPGDTILAKRRWMAEHADHLRRALVLEPRGHADMYACLPTPPVTPDGDVGVLFLHNEGYSTMCGHGIIGLVKVGLDAGLLAIEGELPVVRIDTPAGRVVARARRVDGVVESVSFVNVPSFCLAADVTLDVPGFGPVTADVGYGGAFYACVDARQLDLAIEPHQHARLVEAGRAIKQAVIDELPIAHPEGDDDLGFLYGTILSEPADAPLHSRNVCVFADGEVDRSPTGTGVSCRAALLAARGELALGETLTIASLIGTTFDVRLIEQTAVADRPAWVPEVTGRAHVTGLHEFVIDPDDPLQRGVLLR